MPCLYAGAPVQRVGMALEALCTIVSAVGFERPAVEAASASLRAAAPSVVPELDGAISPLASPAPVLQLVNHLLSAFEKASFA